MRDATAIHRALELYCQTTGMEVNEQKLLIMFHIAVEGQMQAIKGLLPFQIFNQGSNILVFT